MMHDRCTHDHALPATAIDPVCGMSVKVAGARNTSVHGGHTNYFCNPKCLAKFSARTCALPRAGRGVAAAEPRRSANDLHLPDASRSAPAGPGGCPICGMALEPEEVTLSQGPNEELMDMSRRLWIGGALAVPVVALDMGGHLFALPHTLASWIELAVSRRRSCCGRAGRSSCAAFSRSRGARSTCSP